MRTSSIAITSPQPLKCILQNQAKHASHGRIHDPHRYMVLGTEHGTEHATPREGRFAFLRRLPAFFPIKRHSRVVREMCDIPHEVAALIERLTASDSASRMGLSQAATHTWLRTRAGASGGEALTNEHGEAESPAANDLIARPSRSADPPSTSSLQGTVLLHANASCV